MLCYTSTSMPEKGGSEGAAHGSSFEKLQLLNQQEQKKKQKKT